MLKVFDEIQVGNVYLRKSTAEDCRLFGAWEGDESVSEFFTMDKGRNYDDVMRDFTAKEGDEGALQLTVCERDGGAVIGRVLITNISTKYDSMDITRIYIGDVEKRGLGLGEDALRACLKLAFELNGMERVTLDFFTGNRVAKALYEKVGFVHEGCMRHGGKKNGAYVDLNLMSILRKEYFDLKK